MAYNTKCRTRKFRVSAIVCFVLVSVMVTSSGQASGSLLVWGFGSCPQPQTKDNFTIEEYVGVWYELERFDNWFEQNLKCVYASYKLNEDDSIAVENGGIDTTTGQNSTSEGRATVPDPAKPAELLVKFSRFDFSSRANYHVVDTNYSDFAVVFSCFKIPFLPINIQTAWILTRQRGVVPSNLESLKQTLSLADINTSNFKSTNQTDCTN